MHLASFISHFPRTLHPRKNPSALEKTPSALHSLPFGLAEHYLIASSSLCDPVHRHNCCTFPAISYCLSLRTTDCVETRIGSFAISLDRFLFCEQVELVIYFLCKICLTEHLIA